MTNIFFDLDGTLLNSKARLYHLFDDLVRESELTFKEYWSLKKSGISHQEILEKQFSYSKEEYYFFFENWMKNIESDHYLKYDEIIDGVCKGLEHLIKNNYAVVIVTHRQHKSNVIQQLIHFDIEKYIGLILVTEQKHTKSSLIKKYCQVSKSDYMVGDTGHDINCGKELEMTSVGVISGFSSKETLIKYEPDYIFDDVPKFLETVIY